MNTDSQTPYEEKVPMKVKLSYGCGDIFAGGSFLLVALMFMYFLTDIVGLSPTLAGMVVLAGKIWDAISDPLMGTISDRTRSRFGRRRIYFLLGIFPIFFAFSGLWFSFDFSSQTATFCYYLVFYLLFSTAFTLVQIPYVALMPEITPSFNERASVSGIRLIFSSVSAIIAGVVPMIIIKMFPVAEGEALSKTGYMAMGLVFGVFYALPWIVVFLGTKERPLGAVDSGGVSNPFRELPSILKNKSFQHHAGLFIGSQTAADFLAALFLYYITSVLDKQSYYSSIMAALLIVPVIMMPIYIRIAKKYQKTTPMHFGLIIWAVALLSTLFVSVEHWYLIYIIAAISGIGTSSSVFVPWTILPDVTDVDEIISGRRREGIYGGMATFLRKIANGITLALLGVFLDLIGYLTPEELSAQGLTSQSPDTIWGLRVLFATIPTVFILIAFVFSLRYGVNEERHTILREEINRLKLGGRKEDVSAQARLVCERLTGRNYKDLWNTNT